QNCGGLTGTPSSMRAWRYAALSAGGWVSSTAIFCSISRNMRMWFRRDGPNGRSRRDRTFRPPPGEAGQDCDGTDDAHGRIDRVDEVAIEIHREQGAAEIGSGDGAEPSDADRIADPRRPEFRGIETGAGNDDTGEGRLDGEQRRRCRR